MIIIDCHKLLGSFKLTPNFISLKRSTVSRGGKENVLKTQFKMCSGPHSSSGMEAIGLHDALSTRHRLDLFSFLHQNKKIYKNNFKNNILTR